MHDAGVFEGQRYELIDGELIDKMGQHPPHSFSISQLLVALVRIFKSNQIRVQLPIQAAGKDRDWSMPEPDLAVLREFKREYQTRQPRADELLLAIEVADTTASWDRSRKMELYATAGVPEYWVLDLPRRVIVAYREPSGGDYKQVRTYSEEETISPEGLSAAIKVQTLLPEPVE